MRTKDYKSDNCEVSVLSNIAPEEAESMIGKVVSKIVAYENLFRIIFTDGSAVVLEGHTWEDSPLYVDYEDR